MTDMIICTVCGTKAPRNPRNKNHKYCGPKCKKIGWAREKAGPEYMVTLERRISAIEELETEIKTMKTEYHRLRAELTGATQRLEKCETLLGKK